jgi:hypothetical protein
VKDVAAIAQSKASAEDKLKQLELKCLQHVSQIAPVQPLPGCTCMGAHAWVHMHGCTCHPNKTVRGKTRVLCQLGDMAMWARKGGDRAITHLCANHVM